MTLNNYLNTEIENRDVIFDYYLNFLNDFTTKEFPYEEQLKFKGIAGKFLSCVERIAYLPKNKYDEYSSLVDDLILALRQYRRTERKSNLGYIIFRKKVSIIQIKETFEDIYSLTLNYIGESSKINSYSDNLKLNGFFQPENSNKNRIKDLINEAIELINEDSIISEKSKKQIVDYLKKALVELENNHLNWSRFIGRIKETIIVLGALGSLASGLTPIFQAKEKLEEVTIVIQKTSVNINHNVLNETFNYQNIKQIGPFTQTTIVNSSEQIDDE